MDNEDKYAKLLVYKFNGIEILANNTDTLAVILESMEYVNEEKVFPRDKILFLLN